jgi:hypothetical protein
MTMKRDFFGFLKAWNEQSRGRRIFGAAIAVLAGTILVRSMPAVATMHGLHRLAVIAGLSAAFLLIDAWFAASPALLPRAAGWMTAIGLILYSIPFLILLCHMNPMADDFGLWRMARGEGYLEFMRDFYMHWYGRYTSNAVLYWVMQMKPDWVCFPLACWVVGGLTMLCIFACARSLSGARQPGDMRLGPVLAGGVFAAIFSILLPSIQETVLWACAGVHYLLGSGLVIMLYGLLIRGPSQDLVRNNFRRMDLASGDGLGGPSYTSGGYFGPSPQQDARGQRRYGAVCCLIAFLAVGTSEPTMLLVLSGLTLCTAAGYAFQWQRRHVLLAVLAAATVGAAILLAAPGNAQRSAKFPTAPWSESCGYAAGEVLEKLARWSGKGALLAGTLVLLPWLRAVAGRAANHLSPRRAGLLALAAVLWGVAILFAVFCFSYRMTGQACFERTQTIALLAFLIAWFSGVTLLLCISARLRRFLSETSSIVVYSAVLFPLLLNAAEFRRNLWSDAFSPDLNRVRSQTLAICALGNLAVENRLDCAVIGHLDFQHTNAWGGWDLPACPVLRHAIFPFTR